MESLTQEIIRKSNRLESIMFDDMLEKCKWCEFRNIDHSYKAIKHCIKMIEKRRQRNKVCRECSSKGSYHDSDCSIVRYHPCR